MRHALRFVAGAAALLLAVAVPVAAMVTRRAASPADERPAPDRPGPVLLFACQQLVPGSPPATLTRADCARLGG
jgi:hypothetical protein